MIFHQFTLSDQPQDLEIFRAIVPLGNPLETDPELDLAGNILVGSARLQREPGFQHRVVLRKQGAHPDVSEEELLIGSIVERYVQLRMFAQNITAEFFVSSHRNRAAAAAVARGFTYYTASCSHLGLVIPPLFPLPSEALFISGRLVFELWRLFIGIAMVRPIP